MIRVVVYALSVSAAECDVCIRSAVMFCDVLWDWCAVMCCDVLWCAVMYCDVLWCTVLWCTVMHCDVMYVSVVSRGNSQEAWPGLAVRAENFFLLFWAFQIFYFWVSFTFKSLWITKAHIPIVWNFLSKVVEYLQYCKCGQRSKHKALSSSEDSRERLKFAKGTCTHCSTPQKFWELKCPD